MRTGNANADLLFHQAAEKIGAFVNGDVRLQGGFYFGVFIFDGRGANDQLGAGDVAG